jgi:ribosomal protein S18 acetylase RimI-like enzyme
MKFDLRPWQPADEPLTARLVNDLMGPILTEAWGPEYASGAVLEMVRFIREDEGETYVVEVDGQAAGLLGFSVAEGVMHISTLLVDPVWQGQGLGTKLLEFCHEKARLRQVEQLETWVQQNNTRAIRFLERAGFTRGGEVALHTLEFTRTVHPA